MASIAMLSVPAIKQRWPRLLRAIRWAGLLTEEQALVVLYGYKGCGLDCSGSEAVATLGGNLVAIRNGIRGRHGALASKRNGDRTRIREAALQAFWGVVARGYPELHASGLSSDAAIDFLLAADSAILRCIADRQRHHHRQC